MPAPPPIAKAKPKSQKSWDKTQSQRKFRLGVRRFLKNQLHLLIFALLHSIFSLYVKIRQTWNKVCYRISSIISYHHRTPELIENDVRGLARKPQHLSAILNMHEDGRAAELERLIGEAADLAVWSACAGIPVLSIYERSGVFPVPFALLAHVRLTGRLPPCRNSEEVSSTDPPSHSTKIRLVFRRALPRAYRRGPPHRTRRFGSHRPLPRLEAEASQCHVHLLQGR